MPLVTYIAAARAAQLQGAHDRRDRYLRMAFEEVPQAHVAVLLTQAELQIAHRQYEQALATLRHLQELDPDHAFGLKLLAIVYRKLADWEQLRALLPQLRENEALSRREIDRLETRATVALLDRIEAKSGANAADALWELLPRRLRSEVELVRAYARALIRAGKGVEAEAVLRDTLRSAWDEELVALYGLALGNDPKRQLARAEDWLAEHGESAGMLLTAGRLCMVAKLWGKARSYLESSIVLGGRPEAYEELGNLLKRLDESEDALRAYSDGLAVSLGQKVKAYKPTRPKPRRARG